MVISHKIMSEIYIISNSFDQYSFHLESDAIYGLYLRAFCNGMDEALAPFREEIINMEQSVLNDSHTPVSMILSRLQKYLSLFSVFNAIISEVLFSFCCEYKKWKKNFYS